MYFWRAYSPKHHITPKVAAANIATTASAAIIAATEMRPMAQPAKPATAVVVKVVDGTTTIEIEQGLNF